MHAAREQFDAAVATVGSLGGSAVADAASRRRRVAGGGRRGGGGGLAAPPAATIVTEDDEARGGGGRVMVAISTADGRSGSCECRRAKHRASYDGALLSTTRARRLHTRHA